MAVAGCRNQSAPAASPPNILLVVIDTLRADAVSGYGAPESQTPVLERLAREGTLFTRARSTSAWTVPAHASMFTGLYPSRHSAHNEGRALPEAASTLAELLAAGHDTAAFCENPHITRGKQFHQGFAVFKNTWPRRGATGLRRQATDRQIEQWLSARERGRPFFLFVNFMDPHLPYAPPQRFEQAFLDGSTDRSKIEHLRAFGDEEARRVIAGRERPSERDLALLRQLYAAEVASADSRLGRILDNLQAREVLDETLVIVVGDHGENIGDHQLMEHQLCLYESLLRVPLVLRLPGAVKAGMRRDDPVQLVDLFPTVLEAAGIPPDTWPIHEGESLLGRSIDADRLIVAEYMLPLDQQRIFAREMPDFDFSPFMRRLRSVQIGNKKLILAGKEPAELYDLETDPGESTNLIDSDRQTVQRLQRELQRWQVNRPDTLQVALGTREAETVEALRQLGYVD